MICKLCLEQVEKPCFSHIIPELYFKPTYDSRHRIKVMSSNKEENNYYEQKGIREYLLCKKCEDKLSVFEKYIKEDFYKNIKKLITDYKTIYYIQGLNYQAIKLFQLSVIWRATVSTNKYFEEIKLAPKHQERIRIMLNNSDAGKYYEYGCVLYAVFRDMKFCDSIIASSFTKRWKSHLTITLTFGGMLWVFIISSHTKEFERKDLFIKEDGSLILSVKNIEEIGFLKVRYKKLFDDGKI
jgi:hypothetical protein